MQSLFASTSTSPCNLDIKYLFLILLDTSRTKRLKILAMGMSWFTSPSTSPSTFPSSSSPSSSSNWFLTNTLGSKYQTQSPEVFLCTPPLGPLGIGLALEHLVKHPREEVELGVGQRLPHVHLLDALDDLGKCPNIMKLPAPLFIQGFYQKVTY